MANVEFTGIHHLKLPVSALARSREWYGRVLGYAGFDPVSLASADRAAVADRASHPDRRPVRCEGGAVHHRELSWTTS
jgi:catechol 2,3-dioxygenase-like lactoylglutathione lyase family enzyme